MTREAVLVSRTLVYETNNRAHVYLARQKFQQCFKAVFFKKNCSKSNNAKKVREPFFCTVTYVIAWLVKNGTALSTNHEQNHMTYDQPFPALFRGHTGCVWNSKWCNARLCFCD